MCVCVFMAAKEKMRFLAEEREREPTRASKDEKSEREGEYVQHSFSSSHKEDKTEREGEYKRHSFPSSSIRESQRERARKRRVGERANT